MPVLPKLPNERYVITGHTQNFGDSAVYIGTDTFTGQDITIREFFSDAIMIRNEDGTCAVRPGFEVHFKSLSSDFEELRIGGELRLKDLCNVSYDGAAHYDGNDLSVLKRGVHAVQWVGEDSVPATLLMPDGTQHEGRIEMSVLDETGDMVQLERVGFARIEGKSADGVHMVYSHR